MHLIRPKSLQFLTFALIAAFKITLECVLIFFLKIGAPDVVIQSLAESESCRYDLNVQYSPYVLCTRTGYIFRSSPVVRVLLNLPLDVIVACVYVPVPIHIMYMHYLDSLQARL